MRVKTVKARSSKTWLAAALAVGSASVPVLAANGDAEAAAARTLVPTRSGTEDAAKIATPAAAGSPGAAAGEQGLSLPVTVAPRAQEGTAFGIVRAGYDAAARGAAARGTLEGRILRSLALRVEYEHGASVPEASADDRVRIGARLSFLEQSSDGIDAGVALFYDPKDFRSEGNVIFGLLAARRFGRLGLFGNALVGSDPEGDDQTLELRLSPLYQVTANLQVGVDGRARHNLSSDEKRAGTVTTDWDLQALPTVSYALGRFVLVADAGVRMLTTTGPFGSPSQQTHTDVGVVTLGGLGGVF